MESKVVRLTPKKVVEEYNRQGLEKGYPAYPEGLTLRGFVDKEEGIVYLEKGATKTREFHELWHLDHPHGPLSPQRLVDNEILAELHAWKEVGRKPNIRVGIPAVAALLSGYPEKYTFSSASNLVVKRLRRFGVETSPKDKRFLRERFGE